MAITTNTAPSEWVELGPRGIATALELIEARSQTGTVIASG